MEKQSNLMAGIEAASNVFMGVGSSLLAGTFYFELTKKIRIDFV